MNQLLRDMRLFSAASKDSYPINAGHGNMIATLAKNGVGYNVANEKKYDVWGAVRSSSGAGSHVVNPNKQYCANLGHTFNGESGLIYMRARYYEPSSGRFISEDPAYDGPNWYTYVENSPTVFVDPTGKWKFLPGFDIAGGGLFGLGITLALGAAMLAKSGATDKAIVAIRLAAAVIAGGMWSTDVEVGWKAAATLTRLALDSLIINSICAAIAMNAKALDRLKSMANDILGVAMTMYTIVLLGALLATFEY